MTRDFTIRTARPVRLFYMELGQVRCISCLWPTAARAFRTERPAQFDGRPVCLCLGFISAHGRIAPWARKPKQQTQRVFDRLLAPVAPRIIPQPEGEDMGELLHTNKNTATKAVSL